MSPQWFGILEIHSLVPGSGSRSELSNHFCSSGSYWGLIPLWQFHLPAQWQAVIHHGWSTWDSCTGQGKPQAGRQATWEQGAGRMGWKSASNTATTIKSPTLGGSFQSSTGNFKMMQNKNPLHHKCGLLATVIFTEYWLSSSNIMRGSQYQLLQLTTLYSVKQLQISSYTNGHAPWWWYTE